MTYSLIQIAVGEWLRKYDWKSRQEGWCMGWRLAGVQIMAIAIDWKETHLSMPLVDDQTALAHVLDEAAHGSTMHREAIEILAQQKLLQAARTDFTR